MYKEAKFLEPDYSLSVIVDLSKEEILSNVFIDSRNEKFDESLMPIKDCYLNLVLFLNLLLFILLKK